ncbi:molybdopterin molybdotransferase MoeA [Desulfosporosinus nitroreducens]|uniref:Molybdopterin molybdenumtransferase n=1 Tax=Desulfosporosinus nitroreducens TaxID=2018668 RepID=A0ABT8QPW1_9FIRM|nr:gephyrin-like molybdotransferase Glp [Desulfosporosinus nitroreducens]MDO0823389.1 molybdopterin molybdotransferase MoeA [Desulfosporosinus nitroreducens]
MGSSSELFKVQTLAEAIDSLKPYVLSFYQRVEKIPLAESLGRILTQDIPATCALPHFRKSTMDGMAVRAADTFGASESMPALIECCGEIRMGEAPSKTLEQGTGLLMPTGGMLPEGADAVVMVERLEHFGETLYGVTKAVAPGENLIDIGEDLVEGEIILSEFTRIRAQEMGLLASLGLAYVPVLPRFHVGILSTGDEIIPPEQEPLPGQSRDINGYTLLGQALASGADARYYGIVKDNLEELRKVLAQMLKENDVVLLSGGSSVGLRDLSAQLIGELGEPGLLFHGLALKPGKPTIGGVVDGKLIFGLPGHPASAMVVFDTLVRPLLDGSLLNPQVDPLPKGALSQNLYSGSGREEFVRVRIIPKGEGWQVEPVRGKSGLIRTMVLADAIVHIPLDTEGIEAGKEVSFRLLR